LLANFALILECCVACRRDAASLSSIADAEVIMNQHTCQQNIGRSPAESLPELRRRMIHETQEFLNERLYGRNGAWPTEKQASVRLDPRGNHQDRRQMQLCAEERINIRTRPHWGTLVEVRPNQRGVVDNQDLQALESQLVELAGDRAAGNIAIELQHLEVMTAGFMSLLASIRPRLACQQRRLTLRNLQPQCADLLQGTGLEQLVCITQRRAEPRV
jgi:anti-anti-sigma regulatory factor